MRQVPRLPALLVIGLLLVAAAVAERQLDRPGPAAAPPSEMPMGARPGAQSSAFYCTGATAEEGGIANGTVVVANGGTRPMAGTLIAVPVDGEPREVTIDVPAAGRTAVALADVVTAPFVSATVVLDGGQAVVELAVSGSLGASVSPCASAASSRWYFADGVTTRDATEVVALYNPFPEDALVDLAFDTEEGQVTPEALTGLTVRGHGMRAVNLGDHVQRREEVSARIVARSGRIVAGRLQTFDGSATRRGMTLALGAPGPADRWYFPEGLVSDGLVERFHLYNPSRAEARVELDLVLEQGEAEPILLTVPPETRLTVAANDEARIPKDVPHAVVVRETTGVGVVAERAVDSGGGSGRLGVSHTLGARVAAARWVAAAGQADADWDVWLVLHNPGEREARVDVALLDGGTPFTVGGLQDLPLAPGERRSLRLDDFIRPGPIPLLVAADTPVVVERGFYRVGSLGTAMVMAVPLRS
jgi:hypothetical protein